MRRLMLLRHAKTERDSPTGKDRDRALDERGIDDAPQIGTWMVRNGYLPERTLVSTAVRARQTWDLLPAALRAVSTEHIAELYAADTGELLDIIRTVTGEPQSLLIVAHNPGLHELALALVSGGDAVAWQELNRNLPTSGLICIDLAIDAWPGLALQTGTLERFVTPKILRDQPAI
jgi:phosphohistidine phosphatase